jgi:hypothetical protein
VNNDDIPNHHHHDRVEDFRGLLSRTLRKLSRPQAISFAREYRFFIIILRGRNSHANLLRLEKHGITQPAAWNFVKITPAN